MGIRIEIEGADVAAVQKQMQDMLPANAVKTLDDFTLQELIALVEKRAAGEGFDLSISLPGERKSPAEQRKADARAKLRGDLEESVKLGETPLKDAINAKVAAEPEKEAEPEKPKAKVGRPSKAATANGKGEDPEVRKSRVIDRLVTLFNNGKKAAVNQILADHGGGAKTFSVIPADQFGPIDEAVAAIGD